MAKKDHSASASPATSPSSNNSAGSNSGSATGNHVNATESVDVISANDYFHPGSIVRFVTCKNDTVEGEVMAFDPPTRIIILKCPSTNRRSNFNNVVILNMEMVKDLKVIQEPKEGKINLDPPALSTDKLTRRIRTNVERKKLHSKAFKAGISSDGHKVFQSVIKTLDDCDWHGENILVMNKVTIEPPYKPENVKGDKDSKAFIHVKKMVEKHWEDRKQGTERQNSTTTIASSTSSRPSSASGTPAATPAPASPASNSPQPAAAASTVSQPQRRGHEGGRGGKRNSHGPSNRGGGGGGGGGGSNNPRPRYSMQ